MDAKDQHKIDEMQDGLYSREYKDITDAPRPHFEVPAIEVDRAWKHEDIGPTRLRPEPPPAPIVGSFFRKIFIGSIIFFILALGVTGYVFFKGWNIVSADKVAISFVGPVSIGAGDELNFDVVVENNNTTPLLKAVLYIDYPDGTKEVADLTKDLIHEKETLGDIKEKANVRRTIRSVLFGDQHATKEIKVSLEYYVKNSNANFRKEKTYDVVLSSAPLVLTVSSQEEAASGDTVELAVNVTSNSNGPLSNLVLKAEYPFGFQFTNADPMPTFNSDTWTIPRLEPGEKKTFLIRGKVEGQEHDERAFRISIGAKSAVDERLIATAYLSELYSLILHRPLVSTRLVVDSKTTKESTRNQAGIIQGEFSMTNNMPIQLLDSQVKIVFGGLALDPASPASRNSVYRISDKTMIWNKGSLPALGTLDPGDTIELPFSFNTLSQAALQGIKNGSITVDVTLTGNQVVNNASAPQPISVNLNRVVRIQTLTNLASKLFYTSGPFKNTGPVPSKVDTKTTYTVLLDVSNSSNLISNGEVRALLPAYVNWIGTTSPSTENVSFDPSTRVVSWKLGDIKPVSTGSARQVFFQIELQPINIHARNVPDVLGQSILTGTDTFTNSPVSITILPLRAALPFDIGATDKSGIVQQ